MPVVVILLKQIKYSFKKLNKFVMFSVTKLRNFTLLQSWAQEMIFSQFSNMTYNLSSTVSTYQGSVSLQMVSKFACDTELPECETYAQQAFEKWRNNSLDIT